MSQTDTRPPITPPAPGPAPKSGRRLRIALAVSVALNLAVAGLAVGALLRDGPPHSRADLGLGPLSEALTREDRRALRDGFLQRHPDIRGDRKAMRADFAALLAVLRADPFDPAALDAALAAIAQRNAELLSTGRDLVAERLKAMDSAERTAFADRLERAIPRFGRRGDGEDDRDDD
ncbi:MAG: periplasmic heavy metal sensor [Rhodobacter sp.]|nr:periplasmic heavy metal sensor [Rhodobacter sp.]